MNESSESPVMPEDSGSRFPERGRKINKRVLTILFVLFNVSVIAGTAYIDFTEDRVPLASLGINLMYLFAAAGCLAAAVAAESLKYYFMLRSLNGSASARTAFEVAVLGKHYDCITPTGAGGQPFQVFYLKKKAVSTGTSAAMPIAGYLTLQFSFIILAIIVFIFGAPFLNYIPDYEAAVRITAYIGAALYATVPTLIVLFAVYPKAAGSVIRYFIILLAKFRLVKNPEETTIKSLSAFNEYTESIIIICKKKHIVMMLMVFGLIFHIALCSIPYFVLRAFGGTLMYRSVFAMMIMIYCVITFIPTPGNSGAAEASFYALLSTLNQSHLFWAMMIWRFFTFYAFIALGGGVLAFGAIEKRLENKRAAQPPGPAAYP